MLFEFPGRLGLADKRVVAKSVSKAIVYAEKWRGQASR